MKNNQLYILFNGVTDTSNPYILQGITSILVLIILHDSL
jgi:hypothetical protein